MRSVHVRISDFENEITFSDLLVADYRTTYLHRFKSDKMMINDGDELFLLINLGYDVPTGKIRGTTGLYDASLYNSSEKAS